MTGLGFDGQIDKTMTKRVLSDGDDANSNREKKLENITLVSQPEVKYLGHTTPDSGCGEDITKSVVNFLEKRKINYYRCLNLVQSDGTGTSTGWENGALEQLECLKCIFMTHPYFQYKDGS